MNAEDYYQFGNVFNSTSAQLINMGPGHFGYEFSSLGDKLEQQELEL